MEAPGSTENQDTRTRSFTERARSTFELPAVRIAIILLVAAGLAGVSLWKPAQNPPILGASTSQIITYTTDTPDETPVPKEAFPWQGTDDEPKFIRLPTIGAEGFIQRMGVDQNRQISAPTNINFAGWFVDSAIPGQPGLSIIDGHVDGRENDGIFKRLSELQAGGTFEVELGSGAVLRYRVIDSQTVDTKGAENTLFSQDPKVKSQLNLITCGGNFDRQAQLYDKRVIVSAELIQ